VLEASGSRLSLAFGFMVVAVAGVAVQFVFTVGSRAHWCGVVYRLCWVGVVSGAG
jgi:hypothetical protein